MKKISLILLSILTVLISVTYGKFEFNTLLHASEFEDSINKELKESNTYIAGTPEQIKVMTYSESAAELFLEDSTGTKWLLNFKKDKNNNWTLRYNNLVHTEIIYSTQGGSADKFYWY